MQGGGSSGSDDGNGASVAQIVTADGGKVTLGETEVEVPPGAVEESVEITVSKVDPSELTGLPAGFTFAGSPIALLPHGLQFLEPVSVTLAHTAQDGEEVVVLRLDDEQDTTWGEVSGAVVHANLVTFQTNTFSIVVAAQQSDSGAGGAGNSGGTSNGTIPDWLARCKTAGAVATSCEAPEVSHPYCIEGLMLTKNDCGQTREIREGIECDLEDAVAACAKGNSLWLYYAAPGVTGLASLTSERALCSGTYKWCVRPYAEGGLPPAFGTCVRPPGTLWQSNDCMCVSDGNTDSTNGYCSALCKSNTDCLHPTVDMVCLTECADEAYETLIGYCIPPSLNDKIAVRCEAK